MSERIFFGFYPFPIVGVEESGIKKIDEVYEVDSPVVPFIRDHQLRSAIVILTAIPRGLTGVAAEPAEILKHFFRRIIHAKVVFSGVRSILRIFSV